MTGCVKSTGELPSTGAANPPSASLPPGQFVLTNAVTATVAREGTRGANDGVGSSTSNTQMPFAQYVLRPADASVNFSSHVNQTVEVTAKLSPLARFVVPGTIGAGDVPMPAAAPSTPLPSTTSTGAAETAVTPAAGAAGRIASPPLGMMAAVPTLSVMSIRQVGATCS
jgi:hypothetical protein